MSKPKYTMSNLVYGQNYPALWLENQLKSLCDPTNLPALAKDYDLEYIVFTDDATLNQISTHPNFMKLSQYCTVPFVKLTWPADADQAASRYQLLAQILVETIKASLAREAFATSVWVADLVFAKGSLPKMLKRIEAGHDAVINVPIRSAADSVMPLLQQLPGAPSDLELFEMAHANLHHLWVASDWDTRRFSRMPYSIIWDSGTGLVAHNFSVTPIVFRANAEMLNVQGGIDTDLPTYLKNPYWASDWTDAAVAGVEPLSNWHYPPFGKDRSSIDAVAAWAMWGGPERTPCMHPAQPKNLGQPLFYPSRKQFNDEDLAARAARIAADLQQAVKL